LCSSSRLADLPHRSAARRLASIRAGRLSAAATRVTKVVTKPEYAVGFHASWLLVWLIPGTVATLLWWSDSVVWVSWMSLYAIVIGHWSSVQAALADRRVKRQQSDGSGSATQCGDAGCRCGRAGMLKADRRPLTAE